MNGAALCAGLAGAAAVLAWPPRRSVKRSTGSPSAIGMDGQAGRAPLLAAAADRLTRPFRGRTRAASREVTLTEILQVLELVISGLQSGLGSSRAVALAIAELPEASLVRQTLAVPGQEAQCWADLARHTGDPDVALVAQAWELSTRLGARLVDALVVAADALRAGAQLRQRQAVLLTGPRATVRLLTVLPLAGPVVAAALGLDPVSVYLGDPLAPVVLGVGGLLMLAGWGWSRALLRRAVRDG